MTNIAPGGVPDRSKNITREEKTIRFGNRSAKTDTFEPFAAGRLERKNDVEFSLVHFLLFDDQIQIPDQCRIFLIFFERAV